jgi:hypothetical protein
MLECGEWEGTGMECLLFHFWAFPCKIEPKIQGEVYINGILSKDCVFYVMYVGGAYEQGIKAEC